MKTSILLLLVLSSQAFAAEVLFDKEESLFKYSLGSVPGSVKSMIDGCPKMVTPLEENIKSLTDVVRHDKFWQASAKGGDVIVKMVRTSGPQKEDFIQMGMTPKVVKTESAPKEFLLTMGMSNKDALLASRDVYSNTVFTESHVQGDIANRWGHSVIYRIPGEMVKGLGASEFLTTIVGFLASLPKEYLYDKHPSASDIPVTFTDSLGTKSSTFEITVFGDTLYNHRPFEGKVEVFKGSAPFVTWKKKF
jgi:hypothetical protein